MKRMIVLVKCQIGPHHFKDKKIPTKFPAVDVDGAVWVNRKNYLIHRAQTVFNPNTMKEAGDKRTDLFWRYHKAWKMMKGND